MSSKLIESRISESFNEDMKKAIKFITYNPDNIKLVGSSSFKMALYPSDIDLSETFVECCTDEEVTEKIQEKIQSIVVKILQEPDYYITDFKAGIDNRYDLRSNSYMQDITRLYEEGLLSEKEFNIIKNGANPKEILREHLILRWLPEEILNGYKLLPGNAIKYLQDALLDKVPVKLDIIVPIGNRLVEVSNYMVLVEIDEDGNEKYLNIDQMPELQTEIKKEIKKYSEPEHFKPFKMVKRMYSLARLRKDTSVLKKLVPLLRSEAGLLGQIVGDIETIILLLNKTDDPPLDFVRRELDDMKPKIESIINIPINDKAILHDFDRVIKYNLPITEIIARLISIERKLKHHLNDYAVKYLKKQNLFPPPSNYIPS